MAIDSKPNEPELSGRPDSDPENDPTPPIPVAIVRRERILALGLAAVIVIVGMVGWWTIPTDEQLLQRASTDADMERRIGAMNSLALRGYWADRPPAELDEFLEASPAPVRQFIADMHGGLLAR